MFKNLCQFRAALLHVMDLSHLPSCNRLFLTSGHELSLKKSSLTSTIVTHVIVNRNSKKLRPLIIPTSNLHFNNHHSCNHHSSLKKTSALKEFNFSNLLQQSSSPYRFRSVTNTKRSRNDCRAGLSGAISSRSNASCRYRYMASRA